MLQGNNQSRAKAPSLLIPLARGGDTVYNWAEEAKALPRRGGGESAPNPNWDLWDQPLDVKQLDKQWWLLRGAWIDQLRCPCGFSRAWSGDGQKEKNNGIKKSDFMKESKGKQWRKGSSFSCCPPSQGSTGCHSHTLLSLKFLDSRDGLIFTSSLSLGGPEQETMKDNHLHVCELGERSRATAWLSRRGGESCLWLKGRDGRKDGAPPAWDGYQHSEQEMRMGNFNSSRNKDLARRLGQWCGWENPSGEHTLPLLTSLLESGSQGWFSTQGLQAHLDRWHQPW